MLFPFMLFSILMALYPLFTIKKMQFSSFLMLVALLKRKNKADGLHMEKKLKLPFKWWRSI